MLKKVFEFFRSLQLRFYLIIVIFTLILGLLVRLSVLEAYETGAVETRISEIMSQAKLVAAQISANDYLEDVSSESLTTQLDQLSTLYDGRVMLIDESFCIIKDTYRLDEDKTILSEEVIRSYQGESVSTYDSDNQYIELTLPLTESDSQDTVGVMLITVSTKSIGTNLENLKRIFLIVQIISAVAVLVIGFFLSNLLVRPLRRLTRSIQDVQSGYESEFTPVNTYTETEKISKACSEMLGQMQVLDNSRQEFVANVSHELKTPLASMKVLADSLNGQEEVPVELCREFMQDIGSEIDRENKIINDLLALVKMDRSASGMEVENVNINNLLESIMKRLRPIAQKANVEMVLESFRPVSAEIDESKLTLAFTNLIENAIKYNNPEGFVHVSLNADHQYFYVKVEDSGIGIPKEAQAHIFERFYRADKSHSREIGGTGLGLSITRNAVIMHRGAIKVHSEEGEGTTFIVRIPLKFIQT